MNKHWAARVAVLLVLLVSPFSWGEARLDGRSDPQQLIQNVTDTLLQMIKDYKGSYESEPEQFFCALDGLLDDVVDFRFIASNVMGSYRKSATPEQVARFEKVFREELIETYGRGLFSYGNQKIVLLPLDEDVADKRRATVRQEIHNEGKVYPLNYSMGLNREGQWKVTNLVINGINLGKTFRNQFIQRAREFDGDIEKVVENWAADVQT